MTIKSFIRNTVAAIGINLSAATTTPQNGMTSKSGKYLPYDLVSIRQTRLDIKNWKIAEDMANSLIPSNVKMQTLLNEIMKDALLYSQIANRKGMIFSLDISLIKPDGTNDEVQAESLKEMPIYRYLTHKGLDSLFYEYSMVELSIAKTIDGHVFLVGDDVPRTNLVPKTGLFFPSTLDMTKAIKYRDMPEYGTWILEYYNKEVGTGGLLNKAVPHVLFKRFAQSCWSELCEIYGIPPRVLTTNTQDKTMLDRATKMMKDMGSAAWFIIDEDEKFEWAQGVATDGAVYKNLISLCRDEICLLIVGALIGQNTEKGSRSKDESAREVLFELVKSDMAMLEHQWNTINLPALKKHGFITGDVKFKFVPTEDKEQLFEWIIGLLEYFEVDIDFIEKKTGVKITKARETPVPSKGKGNSKATGDSQLKYKGRKPFFESAPQD